MSAKYFFFDYAIYSVVAVFYAHSIHSMVKGNRFFFSSGAE